MKRYSATVSLGKYKSKPNTTSNPPGWLFFEIYFKKRRQQVLVEMQRKFSHVALEMESGASKSYTHRVTA